MAINDKSVPASPGIPYYWSVHTFIYHKSNILAFFQTIFWKISEKVDNLAQRSVALRQ